MSGLAEALRALLAVTDSIERDPHSGCVVGVNAEVASAEETARAALAAHDAAVSAGGWRVRDGMPAVIEDVNGAAVARPLANMLMPVEEYRAIAARIVACVNACTGIADPAALVEAARDALADMEADAWHALDESRERLRDALSCLPAEAAP